MIMFNVIEHFILRHPFWPSLFRSRRGR
jgi:hypothetical protein